MIKSGDEASQSGEGGAAESRGSEARLLKIPDSAGQAIRKHPVRFINRELSWLQFNRRVLAQARLKDNPLLERVNFLSISGSNLDEFLMVRVAGLDGQMRSGITPPGQDGLSVEEQLGLIRNEVCQLVNEQVACLDALREELKDEGVTWLKKDELSTEDKAAFRSYFIKELFPLLTPLTIDTSHPFPFIANRNICLCLHLKRANGSEVTGLVGIPSVVKRFVDLSGIIEPKDDGFIRLIAIEDAILMFIDSLFPGHKRLGHGLFRILRDSEIEIDEEAEDLMRVFENMLRQRRRGRIINLEMSGSMPEGLGKFVCHILGVDSQVVRYTSDFIGFRDLEQFRSLPRPDLCFPVWTPHTPERIRDGAGDIFTTLKQGDLAVHHPYESFDVVLRFLEQASSDPKVLTIKQTLYRTSNDSPIVKLLIQAAESGKNVTAVVELKARFDEEANMRWARNLERAGVQVVYGFIDLKTHAKMSLVLRRESNGLVPYTHIGTGNYHPITATIYTDISFFSSDPSLGWDVAHTFNLITSYAEVTNYNHLSVSPRSLRAKLLSLIQAEQTLAQQGKPAHIWIKVNSLVDVEIIDALYDASQAGVEIELIVRGICCLRPGIEGLSENIRVKSIIGRFLEHSRIFCFGNGAPLPGKKALVFISSADIMQRNLDRRVEILVPIIDPRVHKQILEQIMASNIRDEKRSWIIQSDGTAVPHERALSDDSYDVHNDFMTAPGLSGLNKGLRSLSG